MKTPRPLNSYASTPHKTITELEELATARTFAGENPAYVKQDIIDGYGLGWQSANAALIETAADKGAEMERAIPMKRAETFTPGPWLIADYGNSHGDADMLTVWVERAETHDTCENPDICRVFQIDGDRSETKFANARLIAAAPELLAALRAVLACPAMCEDTAEPETIKAYDLAMDAISKVEGEKNDQAV